MRTFRALSATLALAAAVGCQGSGYTSPGGGGGGGGNAVGVYDNYFSPSALTVAKGATVTWTWRGYVGHSVTFTSGGPTTSVMTSGTIQATFNTAGTFNYHCSVHVAQGMTGTITVP